MAQILPPDGEALNAGCDCCWCKHRRELHELDLEELKARWKSIRLFEAAEEEVKKRRANRWYMRLWRLVW